MNRRRLLQGLSMSMAANRLFRPAPSYGEIFGAQAEPARPVATNDRVRVGVIGPGSRGKELIRQLLRTPGAEIAAVADIYEPRFAQVNQLVGQKVPAYGDYRELLARKDLDAIFVATPLSLHAEHVTAAIQSGRPVYGEKSMGFSPQDCNSILKAVTGSGQIFQIGHEYRYAPWIQESVKRVLQGAIGEPTQVYGYWHRNNNWRRPVPNPSLEHLINWRLYLESSGGLLTELGSHHIDIANWVFGEQPENALGTTSIAVYHDGRTVGDNVQAVFGYSKGRRMFFSSVTDNAKMGNQLWIYGTEGSVEITVQDATFYYEPKKHKAIVAPSEVVQRGLTTGASYETKGEMPYRGPGERVQIKNTEDPTLIACRSFIQCVRTKQQPFANVHVGFASAIAASIGNRALVGGRFEEVPKPTVT